jgi:hypothetical protein
MAILTDRDLAQASAITATTLIHIVDPNDPSQNPAGSSYKATLSQLLPFFSGDPETYITGGTYSSGTLDLFDNSGNTITITGFTEPFSGGSGNCITDLYITNLHGCSPITVWDSIQFSGSTTNGNGSFAFGVNTTSNGIGAFTEGVDTIASANASHAEGKATTASGVNSHAEGQETISSGIASHAEGFQTTASGNNSHAEGYQTVSIGLRAHAEGFATSAITTNTHAEGFLTLASGINSHAEGDSTIASGLTSHAEGFNTQALGDYSHTEGVDTIAIGIASHVEGSDNEAVGLVSHAEGGLTQAIGQTSHAEGLITQAIGSSSHAQGSLTRAIGICSHAGGKGNLFGGSYIFAEGETSFVHQGSTLIGPKGVSGDNSAILGGKDNNIFSGANSSVILGGEDNVIISGASNSVVLGGQNITGSTLNTVYVPDFVIKKSAAVPANSADPIGEEGSVTWDNTHFYWKTATGWLRVLGSSF